METLCVNNEQLVSLVALALSDVLGVVFPKDTITGALNYAQQFGNFKILI